MKSILRQALQIGLALTIGSQVFAAELTPNTPIAFGDRTATLTLFDGLPYVESDYSRRFRFDSVDNPKLKELRERYHLEEVVAPGKDEFDQQVHLMDWTHRQFKRFGRRRALARFRHSFCKRFYQQR